MMNRIVWGKALVFLTAFGVALCALVVPGFYGSSLNVISAAERSGQDFFTVILCLLMIVLCFLRSGSSPRGKVILLGGLLYLAYIYAWFSFGLVWSKAYPLYIALFGVATFLAVRELFELMRCGDLYWARPGFPRRSSAIISIASVVGIGVSELFILAGYIADDGASLNPFDVFIVLDLALVFPAIVLVSLMSLRGKRHGALLQLVVLTKIATVLPGLVAGDVSNYLIDGTFKDPVFCATAALISLLVFVLLCKALISFKEIDIFAKESKPV